MGLFDNFPYTNFHELNLMWILEALKEIQTTTEQFVAINSLKYADPIQWNIVQQYEKNTIVIDPLTGTAYISVQPVPSGVAISNTDYWSVVFDLSMFVIRAAKNFTDHYEEDTTTTATFNSTAGNWIVWGDTLYKALVNITAGDSYVVGGNIQHFTIEDVIGHLEDLQTVAKNNLVAAINELLAKLGDIDNLNTSDKSNAVAAINEVLQTLIDTVGDLDNLTTSDKSNVVAAINEVLQTLIDTVGDLDNLTTSDKSNVVAAINENTTNIASITTKINNLGYVNVKDFGAVGDGVTDDTQAFQNALNTGKNVYVPNMHGESYIISNRIEFTAADQSMFGDPFGVFAAADFGGLIFDALDDICIKTLKHNSLHYINIRNIDTNINAVGVLSPLWESVGSAELEVDHCMFYGFATAINTKGRHINIHNSMFMNCALCILLDYSTSNTDNTSLQGPVLGDRGIKIVNNKMHCLDDKIFIKVNTGNLINALISGNILDLGGRLLEVASGATAKYCTFSNNIVTNSSKTIFTFVDTDTFNYNVIDSNVFLFADTNTTGYLFNEGNKILRGDLIANNIIGRCNSAPIHIGGMIACTIINNQFVDINADRAILINANPALYVTNCIISHNVFESLSAGVDFFVRVDYAPTFTKVVVDGNTGNWPGECVRPTFTDGGNNTIQAAYT